jgi:aryl-alcohol dehydrogenase-like predicted oxidoreductase
MEDVQSGDESAANLNQRMRQEAFERHQKEREALVDGLREFGGDIGTWAIKFALASPTVASTLPVTTSYARLLELAEIADRVDLPREFVDLAFEIYDSEIAGRQVWRD